MSFQVFVLGPDEHERAQLCRTFEGMLIEAVGISAPDAGAMKPSAIGAPLFVVSYEGDGYGLPLVGRLRAVAGSRPAFILIADQICPTLDRAARDLGLLAVLQRPISVPNLARIIEPFVVQSMSGVAKPRPPGVPKVAAR